MTALISKLTTSAAGRILSTIAAILAIVLAIYMFKSYVHGDTPDSAYYTTYIDTENMKPFRHRNEIGDSLPLVSPFSGRATGQPAEACYWTASGGTKTDPTWVLLNEFVQKPGPTFCPDCGRLVVGHNPQPGPGVRPPPTKAEYDAARVGH